MHLQTRVEGTRSLTSCYNPHLCRMLISCSFTVVIRLGDALSPVLEGSPLRPVVVATDAQRWSVRAVTSSTSNATVVMGTLRSGVVPSEAVVDSRTLQDLFTIRLRAYA